MDNLFAPFDKSVALKELGFDEPCMGYYIYNVTGDYPPSFHYHKPNVDCTRNPLCINSLHPSEKTTNAPRVSAPLYNQAFDWFRVNRNLPSYIKTIWQSETNNYSFQWHIIQDGEDWNGSQHFGRWEEAQEECLTQLISIVKVREKLQSQF